VLEIVPRLRLAWKENQFDAGDYQHDGQQAFDRRYGEPSAPQVGSDRSSD